MLPLGTLLPSFRLKNVVTNEWLSNNDFKNKGLVVMFICNHCPFVKHIRSGLAALGKEFERSNIGIVAINSNDVESYPEDSPEKMLIEAREAGYKFPYLFDDTQKVARSFDAACTPDFFVFDAQHTLVYRGQFDDSRPGNGLPVTGESLRGAIQAVIDGKIPPTSQKASLGCNIKWRAQEN